MILGVVLAGGKSSRFGSDKAQAELDGRTLLARAVEALADHCDLVVIAGRSEGPTRCIPDWPRAGMGPLGGIAAGLRLAQDEDFDTVLTCGVDSARLPADLLALLSPAPAYLADQPVVGHWPSTAAGPIRRILKGDGRHSMLAFAQKIGAHAMKSAHEPANINTPADLARLQKAATENAHGI